MENEESLQPIGFQYIMKMRLNGENGAFFRPKHELLANNAATEARFVTKI